MRRQEAISRGLRLAIDGGPGAVHDPGMAKIGERVSLPILRESSHGLHLDGGELGEVLLPGREAPRSAQPGGSLEVFLYTDSEDRPIATTKRPHAMPGEFAKLKCIDVTSFGAFLDWGLAKDLLVPFREQKQRMISGRQYLVRVYVDPVSDRILASSRLARWLNKTPQRYKPNQKVELLICGQADLGYNAIVDGSHAGLLFASDVHQELRIGDRLPGYVRAVKEDGKLDLSLQAHRGERVGNLEQAILAELKARGGSWPIGDHSSPEQIRDELGVSKRTFKQAIGSLLKRKRIRMDAKGIKLV